MQESTLSRLQQLLSYKKSKKFYAEKLGITEQEVTELLKELRDSQTITVEAETAAYISALEEKVVEANEEKGTLKSTINNLTFEPQSIEELYSLHKVDKSRYKIVNYWSKLKSNGKFTSSVFASLKKADDYTPEDFAKFLENYTPKQWVIVAAGVQATNKPIIDLEISIADFHLGKKDLENESIEKRKEQYLGIVNKLVNRVHNSYSINKTVFVISNDFFHTDGYHPATTNGTPQDVSTTYDHEYEEGFDLLVKAISTIRYFCNEVEVVLVQGNHDRTKSFYLAHALEIYFKKKGGISFQRHHSTTKHVILGNTFIGYHHGNCKVEDLPLIFATGQASSQFGNAKYREVHTGDKHHYMAKEVKGVRIQQMPSLSGTDRWHMDNNFVHSIRAALALIYDPILGKIGELEERI